MSTQHGPGSPPSAPSSPSSHSLPASCPPAPQLSALTALSLTARLRPAAVPDALSTLTGLRQLKISHGLSQVGCLGSETAWGTRSSAVHPRAGHCCSSLHVRFSLCGRATKTQQSFYVASFLQVPPAIVGLSALTLLDLSYNALHSLRPGAYLKRLVVRWIMRFVCLFGRPPGFAC